jgi:gag-polyprotein putative aspartyl protease/Aspartyl protease
MIRFATALRQAGLLALLSLAACEAGGSGPCQVALVAELPLTLHRNAIYAPVKMNDTATLALLDTGSETSVVSSDAFNRLHLLGDPRHGTRMTGIGGSGVGQNDALLDRYELAGYDLGLTHYPVIDAPIGIDSKHPVDGMLGGRILSHFDIDLDVPHSRMTLYSVHHCSGNFLPWTGKYSAVQTDTTHADRLLLPLKVNGQNVQALLDTGADTSIIDRPAAERLGVTSDVLAKDKAERGWGSAGVGFHLTPHRFASMQVGPEQIAGPKLNVLDRELQQADMLLGFDYLKSRRVWISYRTNQFFIATP